MRWRPTTPDPQVQDFVRDTRPADKDLKYAPLTGTMPERPKLKSKDELKASIDALDKRGGALRQRGAGVASADSGSTVRKLTAAAAESRRRAAEDYETK